MGVFQSEKKKTVVKGPPSSGDGEFSSKVMLQLLVAGGLESAYGPHSPMFIEALGSHGSPRAHASKRVQTEMFSEFVKLLPIGV